MTSVTSRSRSARSPASPGGPHNPSKLGRPLDPVSLTASVLLLAAVVFAGWSGWSWLSAPRASGYALTRDQALRAGEQAVLDFNTLDYRHVGQGLRLWEQSSTGSLHRQVVAGQTAFEQQVRQAQSVSTARILDAALTSLNPRSGKARIIVALQITVTAAKGPPATKQTRLAGTLTRTRSGWKLSALAPVPVGPAVPTKPAG